MIRKGAASLILNSREEFLLVNLVTFTEHNYAIPGGGLDPNETLLDCAYREIQEELHINKEDLVYVGESNKPAYFYFKAPHVRDGVEFTGSEKHYFGFRFIGDESTISPSQDEVRSFRWVKYADLGNYLLFDNQLEDTQEQIAEIFKK